LLSRVLYIRQRRAAPFGRPASDLRSRCRADRIRTCDPLTPRRANGVRGRLPRYVSAAQRAYGTAADHHGQPELGTMVVKMVVKAAGAAGLVGVAAHVEIPLCRGSHGQLPPAGAEGGGDGNVVGGCLAHRRRRFAQDTLPASVGGRAHGGAPGQLHAVSRLEKRSGSGFGDLSRFTPGYGWAGTRPGATARSRRSIRRRRDC